MPERRLLLAAGALCPALFAAVSASADYADSFKEALVAMDRKEWQQAVGELRSAAAQQPFETGEKIKLYGMRFERYLPYFYLGLAHYQLGDCAAALAAFRDSMAAGSVRGVQRSKLEIYEDVCRQKLNLPLAAIAALPPSVPTAGTGMAGSTGPRLPAGGMSRPTPSPPAAPAVPGPVPTTTQGARKDVLDKRAREAEGALTKAEGLLDRLSSLERSGSRAFQQSPDLVLELRAAERRLATARFRLEASRREMDLESAERARDDALAAVEVLELIAQRMR